MEVNFVLQVRSFHRLKREIRISANAQALWLELFGLFNERRFPDTLPISTTHLSAMLGISSDTVIRARKELTEAGLIETVGDRRGRQHTTYRIKYFTIQPSNSSSYSVDKSDENVDNSECADFCDASQDTSCDANVMPHQKTQTAAQVAVQRAAQPAAYGGFYAAQDDANCGAYINDKQRRYKLKVKRNLKRSPSPQVPKKCAYNSASAAVETGARERGIASSNDTEYRDGKNAELCYNDAWRTDVRARHKTAQNVIDACPTLRAEDGLNELLCQFMLYGMTPEMELAALEKGDGTTDALALLDDAAYSLGIYHVAYEVGRLDVDPVTLHGCGGDLRRARSKEKGNAFRAFKLNMQSRLIAEFGVALPQARRAELFDHTLDVFNDASYINDEQRYEELKRRLRLQGG